MSRTKSGRTPKSPAFQFYPSDYLTDGRVLALSYEQRGLWLHLICLAWLNDGLDPDLGVLARSCGLPRKTFERLWAGLSWCFQLDGGRLRNPRQERERRAQAENREKRKEAGARGNEAQGKGRNAHASAYANADALVSPPSPVSRLSTLRDPSDLPPTPHSGGDAAPAAVGPATKPRKLASGPSADLIRHFEAEWARTRPGTGCVVKPRDGVAAAELVRTLELEEAKRRVSLMLDDVGAWEFKNASLSLLNSSPNRWCGATPPRAASAPGVTPETSMRAFFEQKDREQATVRDVNGRRTA